MNPENERSATRAPKTLVVIIGLILVAGLLGWYIGRPNDSPAVNQQTNSGDTLSSQGSDTKDLKSLVNFSLPDGWSEAMCPSRPSSVYILPGGEKVKCDMNPSSPVKISVDPANYRDCNELQNVQMVSKHVCISEYINGKKSLKAETVYNNESSYKQATTINAYYIDIGDAVIKLEYVHDPSSNAYQTDFESLAKSVQTI